MRMNERMKVKCLNVQTNSPNYNHKKSIAKSEEQKAVNLL